MGTESAKPTWYFAKSKTKHVSQVVITLSPQAEVPPQVSNLLVLESANILMMTTDAWAAAALFVGGNTPKETKGPIIFAKATNVVELLRKKHTRVAFAFYRFEYGGLFQIFVHVDAPEVQAKTGDPYIVEQAFWPDDSACRKIIKGFIQRDSLEVCFVAPGDNGPNTGYFGLAVDLPVECREALKREWNGLLAYHKKMAKHDLQAALNQYNRENPMEETPILDKPKQKPTTISKSDVQHIIQVYKDKFKASNLFFFDDIPEQSALRADLSRQHCATTFFTAKSWWY